MSERDVTSMDVVVFGGGAAGLWLLDEFTRAGYGTLLLEAHELGSGQTIASQGIIHGGLKYTLGGMLTPSARAISQMPLIWRRCLAGEAKPDLAGVKLRAAYCHLWRTASLRSRLAMIGARAGLRVAPTALQSYERPDILAGCPGVVARLDEQVIEPASLISELGQRHREHIIKIDAQNGLEFQVTEPGAVQLIRLIDPESGEPLDLRPQVVVLAAGQGNAALAQMTGLLSPRMQRRPLHMAMARGDLPSLHAHCVDGASTRLTITSTRDFSNRTVWQIGGQIAETGVEMSEQELIAHVKLELCDALPRLDRRGLSWATYRVDRAEAATRTGARPATATIHRQANTILAWPTKMALVPELARMVMLEATTLAKPAARTDFAPLAPWPRPIVALPPWETQQWSAGD